jgi:hypothetical protein
MPRVGLESQVAVFGPGGAKTVDVLDRAATVIGASLSN